jgi:hypothetical protein
MKFLKFCFVHAMNSFIVRCFRKTVCQEMRGSPVWNHFQKVRKCVCEVQQVVSQPHVCVKTQLIAECLLVGCWLSIVVTHPMLSVICGSTTKKFTSKFNLVWQRRKRRLLKGKDAVSCLMKWIAIHVMQ